MNGVYVRGTGVGRNVRLSPLPKGTGQSWCILHQMKLVLSEPYSPTKSRYRNRLPSIPLTIPAIWSAVSCKMARGTGRIDPPWKVSLAAIVVMLMSNAFPFPLFPLKQVL